MHAVVAAMDAREARAVTAVRSSSSSGSRSDDRVPRGGCGIGQLFRGKQKQRAAVRDVRVRS